MLLFGVAYLSLAAFPADSPQEQLTILMGFALLAASVAGSLATKVGLPKITGFLVVGIVAGPSVLAAVHPGALWTPFVSSTLRPGPHRHAGRGRAAGREP